MYFLEAEGKFFLFPESISVTTELVKLRCYQKLALEIHWTRLALVSFYIRLKQTNVSPINATTVRQLTTVEITFTGTLYLLLAASSQHGLQVNSPPLSVFLQAILKTKQN